MSQLNGPPMGDEELLERLRQLNARMDPVPPEVIAGARAAFRQPAFGAELATLMYDSAEDQVLAGVRRGGGARQLTFEGPHLTIELEVTPHSRSIVGQLVPATGATVELRHRAGSLEVVADSLGRFALEGVPAGPVKLVVSVHGEQTASQTEWVLL